MTKRINTAKKKSKETRESIIVVLSSSDKIKYGLHRYAIHKIKEDIFSWHCISSAFLYTPSELNFF